MATNDIDIFTKPHTEAQSYDLENIKFWADTPDRAGYRSSLIFGFRNGNARIVVFTNFDDGQPKSLYVGIDPVSFEIFLQKFEDVVNGEPGIKDHFDNMEREEDSDGKFKGPSKSAVRNSVWFGKHTDGVIWLAISQKDVKNIRFKIVGNGWHNFYRAGTDQPMTEGEASVATARALIKRLRDAACRWSSLLRLPTPRKENAGRSKSGTTTGNSFSTDSKETFEDIGF